MSQKALWSKAIKSYLTNFPAVAVSQRKPGDTREVDTLKETCSFKCRRQGVSIKKNKRHPFLRGKEKKKYHWGKRVKKGFQEARLELGF